MRQVLGPGALGKPRGTGWRGRWEGGSGWGTHVKHGCFISMYVKIHHKKKKNNAPISSFKYPQGSWVLRIQGQKPLVEVQGALDQASKKKKKINCINFYVIEILNFCHTRKNVSSLLCLFVVT